MGDGIAELEIMTLKGGARERDMATRMDEMTRAIIRSQRENKHRVRDISESKAVMAITVLGDDQAAHKEWHTSFCM